MQQIKNPFSLSLMCAALAAPFVAAENDIPDLQREFRAVWIATVANIDWPSDRNLPPEQQQAELLEMLDLSVALNLNAVIFQIRPMADALYASELEPWSEFLTGQAGSPPEPFWDPVEFAVREAHARGLELHVWFNPYRALHPSHRTDLPEDHIANTHPEIVHEYGSFLWMDPAAELTKRHTLDVILDVIRRYNIDGVHIDDYFYPYRSYADGADFPDDKLWEEYLAEGGDMSRDDWRRHHVNDFVERFYKEVKAEDPLVQVGISPFGIWRPGYPEGIQGMDQYATLYADARLWLNEGWVDYFTPQLYWHMDREAQSYVRLLEWWVEESHHGRHVWPGNFTSRVGDSGQNWEPEEIVRQIEATRVQEGAGGNVHFSMRAFTQNRRGLADLLRATVYSEPALPPATPWLKETPPDAPRVRVRGIPFSRNRTVSWNSEAGEEVRRWVIYLKDADGWQTRIVPNTGSHEASIRVNRREVSEVAVSAIDRVNNESERVRIQL